MESTNWTPEEDLYLMNERDNRGTFWRDLEILMDPRTKIELQARYRHLTRLQEKEELVSNCVTLNCMTCGDSFLSANKKTNRRCDKCRGDSDGLPEGFVNYGSGQASRPRSE